MVIPHTQCLLTPGYTSDTVFAASCSNLRHTFADPCPQLRQTTFADPCSQLRHKVFAGPCSHLRHITFADPCSHLRYTTFAGPCSQLRHTVFADPCSHLRHIVFADPWSHLRFTAYHCGKLVIEPVPLCFWILFSVTSLRLWLRTQLWDDPEEDSKSREEGLVLSPPPST